MRKVTRGQSSRWRSSSARRALGAGPSPPPSPPPGAESPRSQPRLGPGLVCRNQGKILEHPDTSLLPGAPSAWACTRFGHRGWAGGLPMPKRKRWGGGPAGSVDFREGSGGLHLSGGRAAWRHGSHFPSSKAAEASVQPGAGAGSRKHRTITGGQGASLEEACPGERGHPERESPSRAAPAPSREVAFQPPGPAPASHRLLTADP